MISFDQLSNRAKRVLQIEPRIYKPQEPQTVEAIQRVLQEDGISFSHPIVQVQREFGGFTFQVNTQYDERFRLGIGEPVFDRFSDEQYWYYSFAEHSTAQVGFYIRDDGLISTDIDNPISSSVVIFLEQETFEADIVTRSVGSYSTNGTISNEIVAELIDHLNNSEEQAMGETIDLFGGWWKGHNYAIRIQPSWGLGKNNPWGIRVYSTDEHIAEQVNSRIIRVSERLAHEKMYHRK